MQAMASRAEWEQVAFGISAASLHSREMVDVECEYRSADRIAAPIAALQEKVLSHAFRYRRTTSHPVFIARTAIFLAASASSIFSRDSTACLGSVSWENSIRRFFLGTDERQRPVGPCRHLGIAEVEAVEKG